MTFNSWLCLNAVTIESKDPHPIGRWGGGGGGGVVHSGRIVSSRSDFQVEGTVAVSQSMRVGEKDRGKNGGGGGGGGGRKEQLKNRDDDDDYTDLSDDLSDDLSENLSLCLSFCFSDAFSFLEEKKFFLKMEEDFLWETGGEGSSLSASGMFCRR